MGNVKSALGFGFDSASQSQSEEKKNEGPIVLLFTGPRQEAIYASATHARKQQKQDDTEPLENRELVMNAVAWDAECLFGQKFHALCWCVRDDTEAELLLYKGSKDEWKHVVIVTPQYDQQCHAFASKARWGYAAADDLARMVQFASKKPLYGENRISLWEAAMLAEEQESDKARKKGKN